MSQNINQSKYWSTEALTLKHWSLKNLKFLKGCLMAIEKIATK